MGMNVNGSVRPYNQRTEQGVSAARYRARYVALSPINDDDGTPAVETDKVLPLLSVYGIRMDFFPGFANHFQWRRISIWVHIYRGLLKQVGIWKDDANVLVDIY
jgi:hypothetical protein